MDTTISTLKNLETLENHTLQQIMTEEVGYQPLLEREVVIRRLTPSAADDTRSRSLFIREASILASLCHPNIVQVYDALVDDNDLPYVVLAKLNGMKLQQRLDMLVEHGARMELSEAKEVFLGVSEAVEYSHQNCVLLNDLSPTNILLTYTGRTVLMGLGQPPPGDILTAPLRMLVYAAPERLFGGPVTTQSDIYSLGVLLYHLIFGRLPFGDSASVIIRQKQYSPSLPMLEDPNIELLESSALVHVLRRATAQTLNRRYTDVNAFRTAVTKALAGEATDTQLGSDISDNGHNRTLRETGERASISLGRDGSVPPTTDAEMAGHAAISHNGRDGNGQLEDIKEVAQVPQTAIDPLMPGFDEPLLKAALSFTTLVPMSEAALEAALEAAPEAEHQPVPAIASTTPTRNRKTWFNPTSLIWMLALGLSAVFAALTLG